MIDAPIAGAPPAGPMRLSGPFAGPTDRHAGWIDRGRTALLRHFDVVLVIVFLASLLFINFFVVHKYAFLLFYFMPVLLAGFARGARHALTAAALAICFVSYVAIVQPGEEVATATFGFWNIFIWACFLLLTGAVVGKLQERTATQMRQIREAYVGIVQILTKYLEAADAYTAGHSERVAAVSAVLARQLGLGQETVYNIWVAALLHDIGKIEVVELIQKAAKLTDEEKKRVDDHTRLGAEIIMTTGTILTGAVPVVLEHHRRYDDGGDAIPLGARIVAVADTYDAVVTDRSYRAGRLHWQAVDIIVEGRGKQFDPVVVDALKAASSEVERAYNELR